MFISITDELADLLRPWSMSKRQWLKISYIMRDVYAQLDANHRGRPLRLNIHTSGQIGRV